MKKIYIICLIIFSLMVGGGLFMSFIMGIAKSFKASRTPSPSLKSEDLKDRQKRIAEEIEDQRKILMENYKQKIEDERRRF